MRPKIIIFLIRLKNFSNKKIIENFKKNWLNEKYQFFLLFLPKKMKAVLFTNNLIVSIILLYFKIKLL
jgi:hypothetical protein